MGRRKNNGNGPSGPPGPFRRIFIMGYKFLIELSTKDPKDIMIMLLKQSKSFKHTVESDLKPDVIVLLMKCLAKICRSDEFPANKLNILNIVCYSNFIEGLEKYFTDLPNYNNYMKQYNSHFWNDVGSFWFDTFTFYESVLDLSPTTAVANFFQLMDVNQTCLELLRRGQMVTFYDQFLEEFDEIHTKLWNAADALDNQNKISNTIKLVPWRLQKKYFDPGEVTDDFRKIDIFPNSKELNTKSLQILRPNIIDGAYKNTNHYLDVQFRLMREDYISSIRDSIMSFRRNPNQKIFNGGRFYSKTRFLRPKISWNCLGLLVSFDNQRKKNVYQYYKRFKYGSLLCFSDDGFKNIFFGTVAEKSKSLFKKNMVVVELVDFNLGISVYGKTFVMFESDVFFLQYGPILKALKSFGENIPMQKYIVDMQKSNAYPAYITTNYRISNQNINIKNEKHWKRLGSLNLDKYQFKAFKMALTREFVTIQGPPGTGKTFIGMKIVETLLENLSKSDIPILVLSFTNHALDQFLEGIYKTTKKIIRIGGRSKNTIFANEHNLKNLRKKSNMRNPYSAELFEIVKELNVIQHDANMNENEDLDKLDLYERYLPGSRILELLNCFKRFPNFDDPIRNWLMYSDNTNIIRKYYNEETVKSFYEWLNNQNDQDDEIYIDETEDNAHTFNIFENFERRYEEKLPLLTTLKMIAKDIEHEISKNRSNCSIKKLEKKLYTKFCELSYLENFLSKRDDSISETISKTFNENNIYSSNPQLRWQIYWYFNKKLKEKIVRDMQSLEIKFRYHNELYKQSNFEINSLLLKDAEVVGMTTTGAALIGPLLKALSPSIVIIEEASKALESHIVANLTNNCKQVILIGDHQQLRPTTGSYRLRKQYKLDVSLFERMFINGHNCVTLGVQHRMRPEISNLITPAIYPELLNHSSVLEYPDVRGMHKNLFFVNHNISEQENLDISSKSNVHEAEFVIALTKYLIQQGYSADDITVVVAYSEQFTCIRELKKTCEIIENVRISVLDNFQGEENKIIILSLVRSNKEGVIGFLGISNRVCVALSRAKDGFYIIGNMDLLTSRSELWQAVKIMLTAQDSLGNTLPLECKRHNIITQVASAEDFQNAPEGGCLSICDMLLKCGHFCERICHVEDNHHLNKCIEKCDRMCKYGHKCNLLCYQECKCEILVKILLPCKHKIDVPCYFDLNKVNKHEIKCKIICNKLLPCGHACKSLCHQDEDPKHLDYVCQNKCGRSNKNCSKNHPCTKFCYEECSVCDIEVPKKRNNCQHTEIIKCHEDVDSTPCNKKCRRVMSCAHHCRKKCYEECSCFVMVKKTRSCGHQIVVRCDTNIEKVICEKKCRLLLSCGHYCTKNCGEKCVKVCTRPVINNFGSICGHDFKIPCYLTKSAVGVDIIKVYLMKYCNEPCNAILQDCKHTCKGTCGSCQSRLHEPCSENCRVTLICGHGCRDPCRKACNMCKQPCEIKCAHSNCILKCGVPCRPCNMPCPRQCPHRKCSKNCGDICDISPCSEPCKKKIACGHPCLGLCGDQCPKICKICSPVEFPKLLFGDEDNDDARFISLMDCPHSVEVTGLDKWMASKERHILLPPCPYCKTIILNTPRYSNQIKITLNDIHLIKDQLYGNLSDIVDNLERLNLKMKEIYNQEHTKLFKDVENWSKTMIAIQKYIQNMSGYYRDYISCEKKIVQSTNNEIINLLSVVKIMKCLSELFQLHNDALKSSLVIQQANFILNAIAQSEANLSNQQVHDLNNEVFRIKVLVKFVTYRSSIGTAYEQLIAKLFTINIFNDRDTEYFNDKIKMFGIMLDIERKMIVKALEFQPGHWDKCTKGHIYCVADYAGAVVRDRCPECGPIMKNDAQNGAGSKPLCSLM